MKANLFSIFLSSSLIGGIVLSATDISEKPSFVCKDEAIVPEIKKENVEKIEEQAIPAVKVELVTDAIAQADQASKGAVIEGIFILQNKKNSLVRQMKRVKIALMEIDHLIKDLVYERQMLFEHFYRNKAQSKGTNVIDQILVDLSVFYGEMLNINLIKGIYPYYLKQLQYFIDDINNTIDYLVNGNTAIKFADLKLQVDKFDNILDIIEEEHKLVKLILEIENIKLSCKKYKERINSRNKQLALYEESVKDKEAALYIDQKDLINSSIKKLKKLEAKFITDFEDKQEKIKLIKKSLMEHYDKHQRYYQLQSASGEGSKLIGLQQDKCPLSKMNTLGWFIDAIEIIRKKLNKNFNREDSV